jgi:hypothetical protein
MLAQPAGDFLLVFIGSKFINLTGDLIAARCGDRLESRAVELEAFEVAYALLVAREAPASSPVLPKSRTVF